MAREIGKLTALAVSKAKKKGYYADGANLYLQITESGSKSWVFRYMMDGKARMMGLGPVHTISLADARIMAADYRKLLHQKIDPLDAKQSAQAQTRLEAARTMSFEQCAHAYIEAHKAGWRNTKHAWQWSNSLQLYAYPSLGSLSVHKIDVGLVMRALEPIWGEKTETAVRVRGRIEAILDWATTSGLRQGENPARWRGHLENLLPRPSKIKKVSHHAALPYTEIGQFMCELSSERGHAARALELVILTASRTSEVLNAEWQEFDLDKAIWIVPAHRIKMGREHRIPLSTIAIQVLRGLERVENQNLLFPSGRSNKPLSNMSMLALLRRMEKRNLTVHGFRSTFRDWVAEQTNYPREVAEAALAHAIENKVEAAYLRSDLFNKRQQMMQDWAEYCLPRQTV